MSIGKRIVIIGFAFSGMAGWAGAVVPEMKTVSEAVQAQVNKGEVAGAVSLVIRLIASRTSPRAGCPT